MLVASNDYFLIVNDH